MLVIAVGPTFLYPALYVVSLLADTFMGDRIIVDHFLTVSKRDIWDAFWGDWFAALMPTYLLAVPGR